MPTSLRSAIVKFIPASCFHTGSARLRLRGLPVRIAMPKSTPVSLNIIVLNFFLLHSKYSDQVTKVECQNAAEKLPRKRNMFICKSDLAAGFNRKQSLFAPDSSRPFGVTINRGVSPF